MSSFLLAREKKVRLDSARLVTVRSGRWFIETRSPNFTTQFSPRNLLSRVFSRRRNGNETAFYTRVEIHLSARRWTAERRNQHTQKLITLPRHRCFLAPPFQRSVFSLHLLFARDSYQTPVLFSPNHAATLSPSALNDWCTPRAAAWNYETRRVLQFTREILG